MTFQTIHFISIGGSALHNLALALQQQGHTITGSDDEIYEPSRTRLAQHGLLPTEMGWFPERVHAGLSCVILGMHARKDNPELARAQELGLPIYSHPDYVYEQSKQKQRVVIAGSHGKTTITAMIMHVLQVHKRVFDYLVGAQVEGFKAMVKLTPEAPLIVIEGDASASSALDAKPQFIHYQPHIALISNMVWDVDTGYPTWDLYVDQFEMMADAMPRGGILAFDETDDRLNTVAQKDRLDVVKLPYSAHPHQIRDGKTVLLTKEGTEVPVLVFGQHNMKNIAGAMALCDRLGITEAMFYEAISSFKGVSNES